MGKWLPEHLLIERLNVDLLMRLTHELLHFF